MYDTEVLHELYEKCKDIDFDEGFDVVSAAKSEDEAEFFWAVTDFIIQQKQKKGHCR